MRKEMPVDRFYDQMAEDYHLLYPDWGSAASDQGAVLARLIESSRGPARGPVLDFACGIGTQAIGLAAFGYTVTGTDMSQKAVERAAREAKKRGITSARFSAADMRRLPAEFQDAFDVAIGFDNPLAHLLKSEDMRLAALSLRTALRPGGLLLLSSRDYEQILVDKPTSMSFRHRTVGNKLTVIFQIWDWDAREPEYVNNHFILQKRRLGWKTVQSKTRMRARTMQEIGTVFEEAGFTDVKWHSPQETEYFQPIMAAVSPS